MTELEKLQRAKLYIDKLANGLNPLDDSPVPEQDVVNQVRVSRCLFFVSQVLGQLVEQGGLRGPRRPAKRAFALTGDLQQRLTVEDRPIPVSEFVRRVNEAALQGPDRQKLKTTDVVTWLLEQGLVEIVPLADHRSTKAPTDRGRALGIVLEQRTGPDGAYQVMLYGPKAQQFLVDHLEGIAAVSARASQAQTVPWTREDETRLAELYQNGMATEQIAFTLGRSASAVRARLKRLGLTR